MPSTSLLEERSVAEPILYEYGLIFKFARLIFNEIRTHNHLARERTLKHLAKLTLKASLTKWLSVCLRTKWLWVRVLLLSLKNFRYGACFEQGVP